MSISSEPRPRKKASRRAARQAPRLSSLPASPPNLAVDSSRADFGALLDSLLTVSHGAKGSPIVMAGTSTENVDSLVAGLLAEGERRRLSILVGRFDSVERRLVTEAIRPKEITAASSVPAVIELSWARTAEDFEGALKSAGARFDLVVLQAPPLNASADAVLLGLRCAGLVLVVEPLKTTRRSLKEAVRRARLVGCPVRGVIASGGRSWIPLWLRGLLPRRSSLNPFG